MDFEKTNIEGPKININEHKFNELEHSLDAVEDAMRSIKDPKIKEELLLALMLSRFKNMGIEDPDDFNQKEDNRLERLNNREENRKDRRRFIRENRERLITAKQVLKTLGFDRDFELILGYHNDDLGTAGQLRASNRDGKTFSYAFNTGGAEGSENGVAILNNWGIMPIPFSSLIYGEDYRPALNEKGKAVDDGILRGEEAGGIDDFSLLLTDDVKNRIFNGPWSEY